MASIKRSLSKKIDPTGKAQILLRVNIDRTHQQRIKSGIYLPASRFRKGEIIVPRINQMEAEEIYKVENELIALERYILSLCRGRLGTELTKEFFYAAIYDFRHPGKPKKPKAELFEAFNEYIETSSLSPARLNHYKVLLRALARFEAYRRFTEINFRLSFENFDEGILGDFVNFLKSEPEISGSYPQLYARVPDITRSQRRPRKPVARGGNTISGMLKRLRAFYNWAIKKGVTSNYPFSKFKIPVERYGTPFYLTTEERNRLFHFDFSRHPFLETQRDIFIFQCLTGCRVSDLFSLTSDSVINGAIEYIPSKTKVECPVMVRVPLNSQALTLISRYKADKGSSLFPFVTIQKYNEAIKNILKLAGITRVVTILDSVTREEIKKPIYEVASSHMARRTFIGNLYKKVKDPNLVGSMSGHKEGSKAFARYRAIDEEMKRELVEML